MSQDMKQTLRDLRTHRLTSFGNSTYQRISNDWYFESVPFELSEIMSITKTKNGTYRLRMYIPEEAKSSLGIDKKVIEKRFKTRSEAKKYELEFQNKIEKVLSGETMVSSQNNGSILFSDFYKKCLVGVL